MKLRFLIMGCILIGLGIVLYVRVGGETRMLILSGAGIVLLIGGMLYPNRTKQKATTDK